MTDHSDATPSPGAPRRGRPPKVAPARVAMPDAGNDLATAAEAAAVPMPTREPGDLEALRELWREVALADDDDGIRLRRQVLAKARRLTHQEIHPECTRVVFDVPPLTGIMRGRDQYMIGNLRGDTRYTGPTEMWACEARQLASMIDQQRRMDRERMTERLIEMEMSPISGRIAAIASET